MRAIEDVLHDAEQGYRIPTVELQWLAAQARTTAALRQRLRDLPQRWESTIEDRLGQHRTPGTVTARAFAEDCASDLRAALDATDVVGWLDRHNDIWREGDDGLMHSHETRPFPREHVEKKWGPLRPLRAEG